MLVIVIACQQQPSDQESDPTLEAFERNSETVLQYIENWQNETPEYSDFVDGYYHFPTNFSLVRDSVTLEEMIEEDRLALEQYEFRLLNDLTLLPGANPITREIDGSVRFYSTWEITKTASDSTEERTANLLVYYSFDFNEEGKITYLDRIGDYTGLLRYLDRVDDY